MRINYRTARCALYAGLLGLSRLGAAQTAPTPDDSLKGRLWTATARRIWADTKPPQARPAPWPTVEAFEDWLHATPTDKSELGLLRGDVVQRFGTGTKGTPEQVAQAILAQITRRQQSKKGRLTRLKLMDLKTDFARLTPPNAAPAVPRPLGDSAVVPAAPTAGGTTALTENPHPATEAQPAPPVPAPTFTSTPIEPRYFGLPPTLAGVLLLLLGTLAGVLLARSLRRPRHHRHAHSTPAEPDSTTIMNSQEYRKLQKQNQNLNTQLHRLQQQLAELTAQLAGGAPTPAPVAEVTPTPELTVEEVVGAPAEMSAAPAPSATRYGPVQETPFVEERKIVDSPLPQLALMLTVNPRNPDQATFTLNPQVDQARLIGDGLTRLQKFFDYDPPLGGRITAVAAVRPGRLQRQDSGWQVVERARLAIS